jgi:hypothetical protein
MPDYHQHTSSWTKVEEGNVQLITTLSYACPGRDILRGTIEPKAKGFIDELDFGGAFDRKSPCQLFDQLASSIMTGTYTS